MNSPYYRALLKRQLDNQGKIVYARIRKNTEKGFVVKDVSLN